MADTASRPETPVSARKLFKASSKTKTPPARRQPLFNTTPQSAQPTTPKSTPRFAPKFASSHTTPKSASASPSSPASPASPTGFRKISGATPKLVRKASSHRPATPSRLATEDIASSTPLAPLTSKLDVPEGAIPEYAASDTTAGDTPIGLIDNDVLTPTDTFSRSTDAPKALSREHSETETGGRGGSSDRAQDQLPDLGDPTEPGSLNETAETANESASEDESKRAPGPSSGASQHRGAAKEDAALKLPGAVSGATDDLPPSARNPAEEPDEPPDLAQYFIDQGNPQMSEFVKALLDPQHDPPSAGTSALNSAKDTGQKAANTVRNIATGDSSAPKELAEASSTADDQSPKPSEDGKDIAEVARQVANQYLDSIGAQASSPEDSAKEPSTIDDQSSSPKNETKDISEVARQVANQYLDSIGALPEPEASHNPDEDLSTDGKDSTEAVSSIAHKVRDAIGEFSKALTEPIEESPDHDSTVSSPGVGAEDDTSPVTIRDANEEAPDSVSGFPTVSTDLTKELPNSDELVADAPSKAEIVSEAVPESSADREHDSASGFPDVSQNTTDELPTNDELVTDTTNKVQDVPETVSTVLSEVQEGENTKPESEGISEVPRTEQGTVGHAQDKVEQTPSGAWQPLGGIRTQDQSTASDKIGVPDTKSITKGTDLSGGNTAPTVDLNSSISHTGEALESKEFTSQDYLAEEISQQGQQEPGLPDQATNGDLVSKSTQNPSALKEAVASNSDTRDQIEVLEKSDQLANGLPVGNNMAGGKDESAAKAPQQSDASNDKNQSKSTAGGIQAQADNMGNPGRINKRVEIPLPMPENASSSRPRMQMPEVDRLNSTDNLKSTDGLPNVNDLEDPPEEFLDPSVHSPQQPAAKISPVPKISKVEPITSQPPPELAQLANGLAGNTVDDVGNIVDESGKVLGHATGDLPAMIGKKVAENGEVYGDSGELIGFVTENFTGHPPPPPPPPPTSGPNGDGPKETPLPGGLKVDMNGNILDAAGNIIGKLNSRPGEPSKALTPYAGDDKDAPKTGTQGGSENPEGEKPRAKFDEGGIPADIFLDVKSTPDGIQVTIRIPTIFKQETRQTTPPSSSS